MHSRARALALVFVALLTTAALGVVSTVMSALALAATALIVPGTGTSDANIVAGYRQQARDRYMQGTPCTDQSDCPAATNLIGIDYPASFWPLSFIPGWCEPTGCVKWDESVGQGTSTLIGKLTPFLNPSSTEDVVIFGYSQGGAVVANTLEYLKGLHLSDSVKDRLDVVTIGGIENPDGGLWQRLQPLAALFGGTVPILDVTTDPAMSVDTGIHTTSIGFEYDPVTYAPLYWGNPLSLLNALAALETVHGYYLSPNGNNEDATLPYGYDDLTLAAQLDCGTHTANCRTDSYGNTYVMIPATSLPLMDVVRSLTNSIGIGAIAKPFIDLVEPVTRVLVDLGYDWSKDPGVSRPLSILPFNPFQNWLAVGVKLVVATVAGIKAFLGDLGIGAPSAVAPQTPSTIAPTGTTTVSRLSASAAADATAPAPDPVAVRPSTERVKRERAVKHDIATPQAPPNAAPALVSVPTGAEVTAGGGQTDGAAKASSPRKYGATRPGADDPSTAGSPKVKAPKSAGAAKGHQPRAGASNADKAA